MSRTPLTLSLIALTTGVLLAAPLAPVALAQVPAEVRQGYSLLEKGWVGDAIATFQRALQHQPQSLEARLGLALAYQRAGQDGSAWTTYQTVLAQDPSNRQALAAVGELGGYRPEWQAQGIEALTTLLTLAPQDTAARAQRALLYGYQGRFQAALGDYEPLLAHNPDANTLLGAAQIYTYSGDFAQGLSLFQRYQVGGHTVPDAAVSAYALALQETGQPDQAVAVLIPRLKPTAQLDPVAVQLRAALAVAQGAQGQPDQALATLAGLRSQPSSRLALARALSALGRQQADATLFAEAVALYQQVLTTTPAPSYGLRLEIADVLGEWPATQREALGQTRQLATENPAVPSLQVKALVLAYQLQEIPAAGLVEPLEQLLNPLPASAGEQRAMTQALLRLPPDPVLLPIYQQAIAAGLEAPLLIFRIAQMHLQQNDLAAAQSALAQYRTTPQGQRDPAVELLLADLERQAGDLEASAQRYEALIATDPSQALIGEALRGLAAVRTLQGQPEAALPVYASVLQAHPDNLTWPLGEAALAYQTGQLSEQAAAQRLDAWLAQLPLTNPPPEVWQIASLLPAAPERSSLYDALLGVDPEAVGIRWRAIQLTAQQNPALAQTQLADLVAQQPENPAVYFYQGELAQQQGDLEGASRAYATLLGLDPDNTGGLSALAGVRFQQGRYPEAQRLYEAVLAQEPEQQQARLAIAELNAAQGYPLAALTQFQTLAAPPTAPVEQRIQALQTDLLRRRGFQPPWERY